MARRLLLLVALALLAAAPVAHATVSQTPDVTDTRYRSVLERVSPVVAGVSWKVIDRNDELVLLNHSHRTVTVFAYSQAPSGLGYDGGPYVQILADGAVQVNENSPAYYLNQSFYYDTANVPASVSASGYPVRWVTLARNGTFTWHDHRIHLLTPVVPDFIKRRGVGKTQFVEGWQVPIAVGATRGYLYGKLFWIGQKSFSFPIGAIIAFIVVVIGGAALVIVVRRRRGPTEPREAW
jgi:hypothetical protein